MDEPKNNYVLTDGKRIFSRKTATASEIEQMQKVTHDATDGEVEWRLEQCCDATQDGNISELCH